MSDIQPQSKFEYKAGDTVLVRDDLKENMKFYCDLGKSFILDANHVKEFSGKVSQIKCTAYSSYIFSTIKEHEKTLHRDMIKQLIGREGYNYKVGDKVRLKKDAKCPDGLSQAMNPLMKDYTYITIDSIETSNGNNYQYRCKEDSHWLWSDWMLDGLYTEEEKNTPTHKYKIGDVVKMKKDFKENVPQQKNYKGRTLTIAVLESLWFPTIMYTPKESIEGAVIQEDWIEGLVSECNKSEVIEVGDTVEYITDDPADLTKGKRYQVISLMSCHISERLPMLQVVNDKDKFRYYYAYQFKLVSRGNKAKDKKIHHSELKYPCVITDIDNIQEKKDRLSVIYAMKYNDAKHLTLCTIREIQLCDDAWNYMSTEGYYLKNYKAEGHSFYSYNDIDWSDKSSIGVDMSSKGIREISVRFNGEYVPLAFDNTSIRIPGGNKLEYPVLHSFSLSLKKNKTKKPYKKLLTEENKLKKSYKFLDKDYCKKKEEERKEKYRIKSNLKTANKMSKVLSEKDIDKGMSYLPKGMWETKIVSHSHNKK